MANRRCRERVGWLGEWILSAEIVKHFAHSHSVQWYDERSRLESTFKASI